MSSKKRMRDREVVAGLGLVQFILIIIVVVIIELWVRTLIIFMTPGEVTLLLLGALGLLMLLFGWSGRK